MVYFLLFPIIVIVLWKIALFITDNLPKFRAYRKYVGGDWYFVEDKWDSAQYNCKVTYWCQNLKTYHRIIKKEKWEN